MPTLSSFLRPNKWRWAAWVAFATGLALGSDLTYKVTLNGSTPLTGAYVTVQTPGGAKTIVAKTDNEGKFKVPGVTAAKVLVTIQQNGKMVYRGIQDVKPGETTINLTSKTR